MYKGQESEKDLSTYLPIYLSESLCAVQLK